mgnify:CR=1 FL=1
MPTHNRKTFYVDYVPRKKEWVIRNLSSKLILFSFNQKLKSITSARYAKMVLRDRPDSRDSTPQNFSISAISNLYPRLIFT